VKTYWNFEETPCTPGTAVVADDPWFPLYWARDMVGQRIPVVKVEGYGYLSDIGGEGWRKVTEGRGGPGYRHGDVEIEPDSFRREPTL
jgi:hypothetical protein